jgi:enoyl-CoA hydratase/carnithine racemase
MAVTTDRQGGVGLIRLDRPPANSYDKTFMDELNGAIDSIRFDESIRAAVVLSENTRFFSAGADIKMFLESALEFKRALILHAHEILQKIANTHKVFIAAIGGHCLGGGLEIALACDLRFAAEGDYRIGLPESTLGLLPGNGGTQRLARLIGRNKALDMILTGEPVAPTRAFELGIVDKLFPPERLHAEAIAYAEKLATGPALAHGNIKLATVLGFEMPLDAGLSWERELVHELFASDDANEGFAAFVEKRPAKWTGK